MGIPAATRLLVLSADTAFDESVTATTGDCPDLLVTTVRTPAEARSTLATAPIECLLVDAAIDHSEVVSFREQLHQTDQSLPVVIAAETGRTLPANLSVHATVQRADLRLLPEVVRIVTTTPTPTDSPAVSAE